MLPENVRRRMVWIWLLAMALCLVPMSAWAQSPDPRTVEQWTATQTALGSGHVVESSPIIVDLEGDGAAEVLLGTTAQTNIPQQYTATPKFIVANADGTVKWARELGVPITGSPAVGDLDGDGDLEIVIPLGGDVVDTNHDGGVIALDHLGKQLWRFGSQDHRDASNVTDGFADGVRSSPTLCDVDGDGDLEIIFGSWDQRIYLLDHQGISLWRDLPPNAPPGPGFYNADTIWGSAACADFNNDGNLEIVMGTAISPGFLPDGTATQPGGFLYVFDRFGTILVRRYLPEDVLSSPAVGDLDGDGRLEIAVGTGWYWWNANGRSTPSYVHVFDPSELFSGLAYADPAKLPHRPGWPQETPYPGGSSPALADLDGNGTLEIVIGSGDPFLQTGDPIPGVGQVHVWKHNGERFPGWPVSPKSATGADWTIWASPVVADVDNDGQLEILIPHIWDVLIYNLDGTRKDILTTFFTVVGTPAVGDTDGDGKTEIWIGGGDDREKSQGYLWRFESDRDLGAAPWPMFQRDPRHSGLYPARGRLRIDQTTLVNLVAQGEPVYTTYLTLRNTGGTPFDWTVEAVPARVSAVAPRGGSLAAGGSTTVALTVDMAGAELGQQTVGTVTFSATEAADSPGSVQIQVVVAAQLARNFLPAMLSP